MKEQLMVDGLSISNTTTVSLLNERRELVDAVNTAYAVKVTTGKKNAKSSTAAYTNVRGKALRASSKYALVDANGTKYNSVKECPSNVRDFLYKQFLFKENKKRTAAEASLDEQMTDLTQNAGKSGNASSSEPVLKKAKTKETYVPPGRRNQSLPTG